MMHSQYLAQSQTSLFRSLSPQGYGINTTSLDAVATWQGLPTNWSKPGDILLIRTGYMKAYRNLTAYEQETMPWNPELGSVGMNASDDALAWLWEKKLALVGADNPAFESLPMDKSIRGVPRSLHQVFIGGESSDVPQIENSDRSLGWG